MATEGWDLEGIPKPWWPYVRDFLVARDLYKYSTLVSDRKIARSLAETAEGLIKNSARNLAEGKAKA
ncbi:MAG TPA: hypothetical protein VN493_02870 [Thermoanaerobaculia bacterium]|nr:hypothetical protein [Thermoanaerobaculia bacterium]